MDYRTYFEEEPFERASGFDDKAFEDEFEVLGEEEFEDDDLEALFELEGDLEPLGFEAGERELFGAKVRRAVRLGLDLKRAGRVKLMTAIGKRFGIPEGDFSRRQSKLYKRKDVRLVGLLRRLAKKKRSRAAAANLKRVKKLVPGVRLSLVLTTTYREHYPSVTARGSRKVETWSEGGLDFLWKNRRRLGLPSSVTRRWKAVEPFVSPETGNIVHPALIPARDAILGYAAQTRLSFTKFENHVRKQLGETTGDKVLANLSRDARLVWQAFAFLVPGGSTFNVWKKRKKKKEQRFGIRTAFSYLASKSQAEGRDVDLNDILTDPWLQRRGLVRSAKTRAAEAVFMEQLFTGLFVKNVGQFLRNLIGRMKKPVP